MAVDEFGREIPAGRGSSRRDASPSPPPAGGGGGGTNEPSHLYGALPTSGYGGSSPPQHPRKRKHRSESPPPHRHNNSYHGKGSRSQHSAPKEPHPSTLYVEEPMLCEFLWKEDQEDSGGDDNEVKERDEEKEAVDGGKDGENNENNEDRDVKSPQENPAYKEYREKYCLNYVRTFFNQHMDDSWFRLQYSPLAKVRAAKLELDRACSEAKSMLEELESSLQKQTQETCYFIMKARLGGGSKQPRDLSMTSKKLLNPVPSTHVLSLNHQVFTIQDVPPFVTEEQLSLKLLSFTSPKTNPEMKIFFSSPAPNTFTRTAFVSTTDAVRKDMLNQLRALHHARPDTGGAHVPRKDDTSMIPKVLEVELECPDPYGRAHVDADGKGGAPEDGGVVPPRSATILISTTPLSSTIQVLSAAVSSKERVASDKEKAFLLAEQWDMKRNIPAEVRCEALLKKALPTIETEQDTEDALDITIAYLRRVHLVCFYNGCTAAPYVGDVLSGQHPTSTIHLRLQNADELLQQTKAETQEDPTSAPKKDLLEQRLDDAIEKALEDSKPSADGRQCIIDPKVDADAKEIERQENQVERTWIKDHSVLDDDGRARCSFHFCHKLFKDSAFLQKHLLKKHAAYLMAERAKCHDPYMMKAWDEEDQRPVPPILVDCGRALGQRPTPVIGAIPIAEDPEPELWRRQEEQRKMEEEEAAYRRDQYQERSGGDHNDHYREKHHMSERPPPRPPKTFVDVDDMKEEKVEMAFDSVEIPVQPPKKKKRKKKLL
jgi:hypothetical protein